MTQQGKVSKPTDDLAALKAELAESEAAYLRELAETHARLTADRARIDELREKLERLVLSSASAVGSLTAMKRGRPIPRPKGGRPTVSKHPFPKAVDNVRAWAIANGLPYSFVKTWYASGKTLGPIPRKWQQLLEHTYQIPASAWRGGISDKAHPQPRRKPA